MAKKGKKVLRFDMPYTSAPPPMRSDTLGFSRLMERRAARQSIDVTILDTADNRLLRAGIVVAHRVVEGLGEWYMASDAWEPWLPIEAFKELDATAELPTEIARLIRPFVRRAPVGPVAALTCERADYVLRGTEQDRAIAEIRDERVTVRRGGIATARYREAAITPTVSLTPRQCEFIIASMESLSATTVEFFPTLQQRLGPPATGLSDFPSPHKVAKGADMEDFVTSLFATDLQQLVESVLAYELAEEPDVASLSAHLDRVRRDVRGLSSVLQPDWRARVEALTARSDGESPRAVAERALDVIDALVAAVRAPKLGDASQNSARESLFQRAERAAFILADRCRALTEESTNAEWKAALSAADQLLTTAEVGALILGKAGAKTVRQLQRLRQELAWCIANEDEAGHIEDLSAQEAYLVGRRVERDNQKVLRHREDFILCWPDRVAQLRQLMVKVRKKL